MEYVEYVGDVARGLALDGYAVLPVHTPIGDRCSCARPSCDSVGKHPRTRHGLDDATVNVRTVDNWWSEWPDANVGIATGDGLVVIDIDGRTGDEQAELLDLPPTLEARTGCGRHLYYAGSAPSRVRIRPGIDIRGDRAYAIAPPSRHASGAVYEWVNDLPMAELPSWVSELATSASATRQRRAPGRPSVIEEGERNDNLFRWASAMRSLAMTEGEIAAAISVTNADRCQPPLDDEEVARIAASASKYPVRRISDGTLLDLQLGPIPTTVYLALRRCANRHSQCWPSYAWLAEKAGVGRTAVSEALSLLRDARLIDWERRPNNSNLYTLLPDPSPEEA